MKCLKTQVLAHGASYTVNSDGDGIYFLGCDVSSVISGATVAVAGTTYRNTYISFGSNLLLFSLSGNTLSNILPYPGETTTISSGVITVKNVSGNDSYPWAIFHLVS